MSLISDVSRDVVTRSPHRRVGLIACPWFQSKAVAYESLLERDFVRLSLFDLDISSITHQPFKVELGERAGSYYIPDFLLVGEKKKVVVEVKPERFARNARHAPRLSKAKEILEAAGFSFVIATEERIQRKGCQDRAAILLRHARGHLNPDVLARILTKASRAPEGIRIGVLAREAGVASYAILHAVGRRLLRINSDFSISENGLVYPIGGLQ